MASWRPLIAICFPLAYGYGTVTVASAVGLLTTVLSRGCCSDPKGKALRFCAAVAFATVASAIGLPKESVVPMANLLVL